MSTHWLCLRYLKKFVVTLLESYLALAEVGASEAGVFFEIFRPPEQFFVALIVSRTAFSVLFLNFFCQIEYCGFEVALRENYPFFL